MLLLVQITQICLTPMIELCGWQLVQLMAQFCSSYEFVLYTSTTFTLGLMRKKNESGGEAGTIEQDVEGCEKVEGPQLQ